jgi:hypothetical protein
MLTFVEADGSFGFRHQMPRKSAREPCVKFVCHLQPTGALKKLPRRLLLDEDEVAPVAYTLKWDGTSMWVVLFAFFAFPVQSKQAIKKGELLACLLLFSSSPCLVWCAGEDRGDVKVVKGALVFDASTAISKPELLPIQPSAAAPPNVAPEVQALKEDQRKRAQVLP